MKNIYKAIGNVMQALGSVEKTGQMKGKVQYAYYSENDLLNALRPLFKTNGLVIFPSGVKERVVETYETSRGNTQNHVVATYQFTIGHIDSGESVTVEVQGEGADSGDKSVNKAATGAMKYALRQTFMVATGDDPDATDSDAQTRSTKSDPADDKKKPDAKQTQKQQAPKQEPEKVNPEWMEKALSYKIPEDALFPGKELRYLLKDKTAGPMVIEYLCGHDPNGDGNMFEVKTEEDESLQKAALYVHKFNEDYKKMLEEYKATVN